MTYKAIERIMDVSTAIELNTKVGTASSTFRN